MKIDELYSLSEPFLHGIYCDWSDVAKCIYFGENTYIANIEGNNCKSLEDLFSEFARAFQFPDYFGGNWAALDECINDLEWLPSSNYVVLIKNANLVLDSEPKQLQTLLRILRNTAIEWGLGRQYDDFPTEPTPFHIIFHGEKDMKSSVIEGLSSGLSNGDYDEIELHQPN
jgi:RNAse (barnase) inhibitor barstar